MKKKIAAAVTIVIALVVVFLIWTTGRGGAAEQEQNRYYITVARCGVPEGNYSAQPERGLRTYNNAYGRAQYVQHHWRVRTVYITDAFNGQVVGWYDADHICR